ncbi:hypothetical protein MRX96_027830 [Rhipicephalus microplus]
MLCFRRQQDCEYDKVDILSKMDNNTIRKHGLFCGSYLPPIITSEGNSLRIEFSSDNSVQKSGFAAGFLMDKDECAHNNGGCQHICKNTVGSYMCTCQNGFVLHPNEHDCNEGTCTHQISAPLGEINSPNYPDAYPSRKDCAWLFTTTPGHRLKLIFNDFELEPHQECAYDHISLYDSDSTDAPTLGRFCGAKVPHPILSTTNRMYMVRSSTCSRATPPCSARASRRPTRRPAKGGCWRPGAPWSTSTPHAKYGDQNYENREDCDWLVEAESGHVRLRFLTFELEHEQDCGYDFVQLFDGYDDSAPQLGKFCGNKMPGEFTSSSGSLLLRFRSDDNINAKGFSAAYSAVDTVEFGQQHAPGAAPPFPAGASGSFSEVRAPHRRERRLRLHRHRGTRIGTIATGRESYTHSTIIPALDHASYALHACLDVTPFFLFYLFRSPPANGSSSACADFSVYRDRCGKSWGTATALYPHDKGRCFCCAREQCGKACM